MERNSVSKNINIKWRECLAITIAKNDFPTWFYETLLEASNAISVSHEGLYHYLLSTVNYSLLHADVHVDGMEWKEPVLLWNLVISVSGSRKTLIYKICTKLMNDAFKLLAERDNIEITQWEFKDGSVERIGVALEKNKGKISLNQDEAARYINISSNGSTNRNSKEASVEMLFLEGWNASELIHQTVSGTNYHIERSGILAGGFTQPDIGLAFLKDSARSSTGFAQRFAFHFIDSKHLKLSELSSINEEFKSAMIEDVLYPLLRLSNIRGNGVMKYIVKKSTDAYQKFETFHDNMSSVKQQLSENYVSGYDVICSYIGKMDAKVLREAAILTELLPRLKKSLDKRNQPEVKKDTITDVSDEDTRENVDIDSGVDSEVICTKDLDQQAPLTVEVNDDFHELEDSPVADSQIDICDDFKHDMHDEVCTKYRIYNTQFYLITIIKNM